jgi:hypothetical protein
MVALAFSAVREGSSARLVVLLTYALILSTLCVLCVAVLVLFRTGFDRPGEYASDERQRSLWRGNVALNFIAAAVTVAYLIVFRGKLWKKKPQEEESEA